MTTVYEIVKVGCPRCGSADLYCNWKEQQGAPVKLVEAKDPNYPLTEHISVGDITSVESEDMNVYCGHCDLMILTPEWGARVIF